MGKPTSKEQGADHVLSRFGKRDREEMAVTIEEAADAVEMILADGVDAAMNRYNGRDERELPQSRRRERGEDLDPVREADRVALAFEDGELDVVHPAGRFPHRKQRGDGIE